MTDHLPHLQPKSEESDSIVKGESLIRRPIGVWLVSLFVMSYSLALLYIALQILLNDPSLYETHTWWEVYKGFFYPLLLIAGAAFLIQLKTLCVWLFLSYLVLAKYKFLILLFSAGGGMRKIQIAFEGQFGLHFFGFVVVLIPLLYALHLKKTGVLQPLETEFEGRSP